MTPFEKLECLLRTIVFSIAQKTAVPLIEHYEHDARFVVQVKGSDQGRLVGKGGSHIWSIQALLWYGGLAQLGWSYSVKLLEPSIPCRGLQSPFKFREDWNRERITTLASQILSTCCPGHASYTMVEESGTSAVLHLDIQKYLQLNMTDPSFTDAFATVCKAAGMSQGVNVKTEARFI